MPFANHLRLTAVGYFTPGTGSIEQIEQFSFRLNLSKPGIGGDELSQSRVDDYAADLRAFFVNPTTKINGSAVLGQIKLAAIGADGKYLADPVFASGAGVRGGVLGVALLPLQVALAVSLDTDTRGPRGRGRFYLPGPACALDPDSTIGATDQTNIRANVKTLIDALNNVPGVDGVAPKVTIASSFGVNSDVTSVRVGQVLDTIRTRRRSLPEAYTAPLAIA